MMRTLIRQLEEAAPAPGSKQWITGVKKWWGQWVKDAARISKILDAKDRPQVQAWLDEGERRIAAIKDALVRTLSLHPDDDVARVAVQKVDKASYGEKLALPRKIAGLDLSRYPSQKVLIHLEAALKRLRELSNREDIWYRQDYPSGSAKDKGYTSIYGGASKSEFGKQRNLNAWQAEVEALVDTVGEVDYDVQATLRLFQRFDPEEMARRAESAVPLEYKLGAMKVLTDPGAAVDLDAQVRGGQDDRGTGVNVNLARVVLDGLKEAQRAMQQRGFQSLWRGLVYVVPGTKAIKGMRSHTGELFQSGGHYGIGGDAIMVNPRTDWSAQSVAGVVVHELGHRYWYKFMKAGARERFSAWFDPRTKAAQEREGPKAGYVPAPTSYGAESDVEEFAEIFAAYVLGKYKGITLTGPQKARFEALALGRAAQSESLLAILSRMIEDDDD